MATKRHLPVLNTPAPPAAPAPTDEAPPPPPWHWVPLGTLASLLASTVLARSFFDPYKQRLVVQLYLAASTPAEAVRIRAHAATGAELQAIDARVTDAARDALLLKLVAGGALVAALGILAGGFVVGRFGARTNARHGTLAGLFAMLVVVLLIGRGSGPASYLAWVAMVPFGALAGYLGARGGVYLRARAAAG